MSDDAYAAGLDLVRRVRLHRSNWLCSLAGLVPLVSLQNATALGGASRPKTRQEKASNQRQEPSHKQRKLHF
jgi:hypothetical protein